MELYVRNAVVRVLFDIGFLRDYFCSTVQKYKVNREQGTSWRTATVKAARFRYFHVSRKNCWWSEVE